VYWTTPDPTLTRPPAIPPVVTVCHPEDRAIAAPTSSAEAPILLKSFRASFTSRRWRLSDRNLAASSANATTRLPARISPTTGSAALSATSTATSRATPGRTSLIALPMLPTVPITRSAVRATALLIAAIACSVRVGQSGLPSGHRPNGSVNVTGLLPAYAYRLTPPASPIGSWVRNRPVLVTLVPFEDSSDLD